MSLNLCPLVGRKTFHGFPLLSRCSHTGRLPLLLGILKFGQHFPLVAGRVWPVGIQTRLLLWSSFTGLTNHRRGGIKIIIIVFVQEILVLVCQTAAWVTSFHFCSSRSELIAQRCSRWIFWSKSLSFDRRDVVKKIIALQVFKYNF